MANCPSLNLGLPVSPSLSLSGSSASAALSLSEAPRLELSVSSINVGLHTQGPNVSFFPIGKRAGVISLNGLSGALNIVGGENVQVSTSGNNILINVISGGGSNFNPSGYITTGQADARYYPLNSNPSGYISGFNSGQYALGNDLYQTGADLLNLINMSSAGVSSLNSKTGHININGAGNVSILNNGQVITVSGDTGAYENFASKTELYESGSTLYNRDNSISGDLNQKIDNISGLYVLKSGQQVFKTGVLTGLTNYYINYPNPFVSIPKISATIETESIYSYMFSINTISSTGFGISFSDEIQETGLYINIFAQLSV